MKRLHLHYESGATVSFDVKAYTITTDHTGSITKIAWTTPDKKAGLRGKWCRIDGLIGVVETDA